MFATLKRLLDKRPQRGKLLGHLREPRAQLDRRPSVLGSRWIPVPRIQLRLLRSSFGPLRRAFGSGRGCGGRRPKKTKGPGIARRGLGYRVVERRQFACCIASNSRRSIGWSEEPVAVGRVTAMNRLDPSDGCRRKEHRKKVRLICPREPETLARCVNLRLTVARR
jgi:hypothetical protein